MILHSPPSSSQYTAIVLLFCGAVIAHAFSIWVLRKSKSHQIYVIWYMFSLFFVLFSMLYAYARASSAALEDAFGSEGGRLFKKAYEYLTDLNGEVQMVLIFFGLAVVPQCLTYVLSGLSGSASPPKFVLQVTDVAIWSLVKFLAALSGIVLAASIWEGEFAFYKLASAEITLSAAFTLLFWRYVGPATYYSAEFFAKFRNIHDYLTRFSRSPEPHSFDIIQVTFPLVLRWSERRRRRNRSVSDSSTPPKMLNQPGFEHARHEGPDGAERT